MCITIIGILMGMMFPVFSKAIKKARSVGSPVDPNDNTKGQYAPSSVSHLNNFDGTKPLNTTSQVPLLSDSIKNKRLELTTLKLPNEVRMFAQFTAQGKVQIWTIGPGKSSLTGTYTVQDKIIKITKRNGQEESWSFSHSTLSWGVTINMVNSTDGTNDTFTVVKVGASGG